MRIRWHSVIAVMLVGALVQANFAAAAATPAVSTATPVAVSTAVPIIQITPHTHKTPQDTKWGWKEWAIIIGSILTLGAVAAVEASNHSNGSGSNSGSGMNGM